MKKIFIEDTEIKMLETQDETEGQHSIERGFYINRSTIKVEFKSSIFSYGEDIKVLISKIKRFSEEYFKIVIFNDKDAKAWTLIELSCKLEVKVKKVSEENFIITGDSKGEKGVMSQISFCKLKPSTKVEEITINFSKLNNIHFLGEDRIVVSYSDIGPMDTKALNTLAMYSKEGKLRQTIYEFYDGASTTYRYEIDENNKLKAFKKETGQ